MYLCGHIDFMRFCNVPWLTDGAVNSAELAFRCYCTPKGGETSLLSTCTACSNVLVSLSLRCYILSTAAAELDFSSRNPGSCSPPPIRQVEEAVMGAARLRQSLSCGLDRGESQ
jgi:hypothetical protein